jgi:DNA-binding MarR family transcriptional regulator
MSETVITQPGTLSLLSRLSKSVYRKTTDDLLGMKLRHFLVISYLAEQPSGVPQQFLQDVAHMDANNIVILLNEIESLGWIQRLRDPEDRRRHIVVLTDSGRAAFMKAEKARETVEDDVLHTLDHEERETLRRLLAKAIEG